jgi:YesN/AraC family two-component response regulator
MLELGEVFNCYEATNGKEGYDMALKLMPDLILSDVLMPVMDGREFCRSIKENIVTNHIPVILLTAKTEPEDQIEGYEAGADAYIVKPFRPDQLTATIISIVENRKRLRDKLSIAGGQSKSGSRNTVEDRFINKVNEIINNNLSDSKFGVNELAQELGMSRVHLHRKMKAIADIGPNEHIRKIRLQKAAHLLLKKELSISEISAQVGFSSTTYFSSCFKEYFNLSPREYMEREDR